MFATHAPLPYVPTTMVALAWVNEQIVTGAGPMSDLNATPIRAAVK